MEISEKIGSFHIRKAHVLLTILGIAAALIFVEIGLRLLVAHQDPILFCRQADEILHHRYTANSTCRSKTSEWDVIYHINSLGFREREVGGKQPDEYRILVLGDSFVEGYGVLEEQRFTNLLGSELRGKTKKNIQIVNAGISTYSPILELQFLKSNLEKLQPDLVLVALDMTDFKDEIGYYNFLVERDREKPEEAEKSLTEEDNDYYLTELTAINTAQSEVREYKAQTGWQRNKNLPITLWLKMLLRKSELYVVFTNFVKDKMNRPYLVFGSPPFIEGDIETDIFAVARNNIDESVYQSLWMLPKRSFLQMRDFAREKGFDIAFFVYPHGMQLDGKQWGKGRLTRGFVRGETYSARPLEEFVKIGEELDVPTLNMLGAFRKNVDKKLFFDFDGHLTAVGHEVVAEELNKFATENIESLN